VAQVERHGHVVQVGRHEQVAQVKSHGPLQVEDVAERGRWHPIQRALHQT
jgi:hypothetical protein